MKLHPTNRTVKKSKPHCTNGIVPVPNHLKPLQQMRYPPDNAVTFERWYYNAYLSTDERSRVYLPIQWTALYCNNQFGACARTQRHIQNFLNTLDKTKKYYTIVQYDDGILNDISHLDIKVFAMSGPRIDYPLPLLCQPHGFTFPNTKRDIFASFVGRLTHPIRKQMFDQLKHLPGYFLAMDTLPLKHYCEILARSKYALCPRGYGQTSFRIQEAIEYGAVPVYISDQHILPYNIEFDGILLSPVADIHKSLAFYNDNTDIAWRMDSYGRYQYTYAGCKQMILNELENENASSEVLA
jgi:hypothetical protein